MSRWKVESVAYGTFRLWLASEQQPWGWAQRGEFESFKKAIAEVDRMARTVTVQIPKATSHLVLTNGSSFRFPRSGGVWVSNHTHQSHVGIPQTDLEPLALALLAHARKKKQ